MGAACGKCELRKPRCLRSDPVDKPVPLSPEENHPGRCRNGHVLEMFATPTEGGVCQLSGRGTTHQDALVRGCRRCKYDICETTWAPKAVRLDADSRTRSCNQASIFGIPIQARLHYQGPTLKPRYSADNVLIDNNEAWLGPDKKPCWFILDLGPDKVVSGFEIQNLGGDVLLPPSERRCTTEFTIEASETGGKDESEWKLVVKSQLSHKMILSLNGTENHMRPEIFECPSQFASMRFVRFYCRKHDGSDTYDVGGGLSYFAALHKGLPTSYASIPRPPSFLWDREDQHFLKMVKCHAVVRILHIDPKHGTFRLRMKCHWAFRTARSRLEAEMQLRGVPGIRMPALKVTVEESRLWKHMDGRNTNDKSVYWKGTSTFTLEGYKHFHMESFPFDRHVLNLEQFHFVWRTDKDAADHFEPMKVVSLTIHTDTFIPQWKTLAAYVIPIAKFVSTPPAAPSSAAKFIIKLPIERISNFYIANVFFPALLITFVSCLPLVMPPMVDDMGDRLASYGGGLLTLVAFKYGVDDHLPSVPYRTYVDNFLQYLMVTIALAGIESAVSFNVFMQREVEWEGFVYINLDTTETTLYFSIFFVWSIIFLYSWRWRPLDLKRWEDLYFQKEDIFEQIDMEDLEPHHADEIPAGTKLVIKRDGISEWDIESHSNVGTLSARDQVTAASPLKRQHSEKRFGSVDDQMCSPHEMRKYDSIKYGSKTLHENEQYYTKEMIPIHAPYLVRVDATILGGYNMQTVADALDANKATLKSSTESAIQGISGLPVTGPISVTVMPVQVVRSDQSFINPGADPNLASTPAPTLSSHDPTSSPSVASSPTRNHTWLRHTSTPTLATSTLRVAVSMVIRNIEFYTASKRNKIDIIREIVISNIATHSSTDEKDIRIVALDSGVVAVDLDDVRISDGGGIAGGPGARCGALRRFRISTIMLATIVILFFTGFAYLAGQMHKWFGIDIHAFELGYDKRYDDTR